MAQPAPLHRSVRLNSAFTPVGRPRSSPQSAGQQGLAQLADSLNRSPKVEAQKAVSEQINERQPFAQFRQTDEQKPIQRKPLKEEKPLAQTKSKLEEKNPAQAKFAKSPVPVQREAPPPPNRTGLPLNLKAGIESISGISMDKVNVHYNSSQPAQLNALAYTQGADIHVAPGQEKHLPHEAWHVVQQSQGRVQPTTQMKQGTPINDDQSLEHEADLMGAKAVANAAPLRSRPQEQELRQGKFATTQRSPSDVTQRKVGFEFEVNAPLYHEGEKEDMFSNKVKEKTTFSKAEKLHNQAAFHIVQDHATRPIAGVNTIAEFVIHETEESLPKKEFLHNVTAAYELVLKTNRILTLNTKPPAFVGDSGENPLSTLRSGSAQATYGVLPEGVPTVFADKPGRLTEQKSLLHEADIMQAANSAAAEVIKHEAFDGSTEPAKIQGFLALICMYCVSNSIENLQQGPALDKNKVPFLVRSTMGLIAEKTLSEDSRLRLQKYAGPLTDRILRLTEANSGMPIISPTSAEKEKVLNVNAALWVNRALLGNDEPLKWGSMNAGEDSALIPPERVGRRGEGEDTRPFGAVMEERNLVQGEVYVKDWVETAEKVWAYVRKANKID
jgi:Domain of unknown function (DUF4157)